MDHLRATIKVRLKGSGAGSKEVTIISLRLIRVAVDGDLPVVTDEVICSSSQVDSRDMKDTTISEAPVGSCTGVHR